MILLRWCALLLALSVFGGTAFAETIPATPAGTVVTGTWQAIKTSANPYQCVGTLAQACDQGRVGYGVTKGSCSDSAPTSFSAGASAGSCGYVNTYNQTCTSFPAANWDNCCPEGSAPESGQCKTVAASCPAGQGWTLSGSNCVRSDCAAGQVRENGVCVSACGSSGATWNGLNCQCPGIQTFSAGPKTCNCETGARLKGTSISGSGSVPSSTCYSNCVAGVGGIGISAGGVWAAELGSFTGAKCSEDAPHAKTTTQDTRTPEEKCVAAGGGFITTASGTVCTSSKDSPTPVTKKVQDTKTVTTAAGTTTETTTTECVGAQCTTTVVTKDAAGAVVSTTTTAGSGAGSGSGMPGGNSAGGGGGGDGDGETDCDKYPQSIGCSEYGEPGGSEEIGTKEVGVSQITAASLASNDSCPPDVNIRNGIKVSYEYVCMYARALKPIVIALAWLAAGFMVFGMRID